jgi:hypothetical protein
MSLDDLLVIKKEAWPLKLMPCHLGETHVAQDSDPAECIGACRSDELCHPGAGRGP